MKIIQHSTACALLVSTVCIMGSSLAETVSTADFTLGELRQKVAPKGLFSCTTIRDNKDLYKVTACQPIVISGYDPAQGKSVKTPIPDDQKFPANVKDTDGRVAGACDLDTTGGIIEESCRAVSEILNKK